MRYLFYSNSADSIGSIGLLLLRLVVGAAFLIHGWPKINHPMDWMGPNATMPGVLQCLAGISEFGGGLALIFGLLTRLASLGIVSTMVVAIATVHLPNGHAFVNTAHGPSYEIAAVYLACAVLFVLIGAGRFSLDALLFGGGNAGNSRVSESSI